MCIDGDHAFAIADRLPVNPLRVEALRDGVEDPAAAFSVGLFVDGGHRRESEFFMNGACERRAAVGRGL